MAYQYLVSFYMDPSVQVQTHTGMLRKEIGSTLTNFEDGSYTQFGDITWGKDYVLNRYGISHKVEYGNDGQTVTDTWLVPAGLQMLDETLRKLSPEPDFSWCQHSYDCCGNWYTSGVDIERGDTHDTVTQTWYQNI